MALWPVEKLRRQLAAQKDNPAPKGFAVAITTGAMNPLHTGHVELLHRAKQRLEDAGYCVVGLWLSPSHDGYVQPKAKSMNRVGLSDEFRLYIAQEAVKDEELIDVASWEARRPGKWPDYPVVCRALQDELSTIAEASQLQHYNEEDEEYHLQVFYACGSDHAAKADLYRGLRPDLSIGVVVVPREGESTKEESEEDLVYVASIWNGEVASFSSTKIRDALFEKELGYVEGAMPEHSAAFLLRPTEEEYTRFEKDFLKLGITRN